MLSNNSKSAKSWINGPTHKLKNQCLPGYQGFIPGIKCENVFSTTFAKNSASSFENKIERRYPGSNEERFKTMQKDKFNFSANRRINQDPKFAPKRDYIEYTISANIDKKH